MDVGGGKVGWCADSEMHELQTVEASWPFLWRSGRWIYMISILTDAI